MTLHSPPKKTCYYYSKKFKLKKHQLKRFLSIHRILHCLCLHVLQISLTGNNLRGRGGGDFIHHAAFCKTSSPASAAPSNDLPQTTKVPCCLPWFFNGDWHILRPAWWHNLRPVRYSLGCCRPNYPFEWWVGLLFAIMLTLPLFICLLVSCGQSSHKANKSHHYTPSPSLPPPWITCKMALAGLHSRH